MAFKPNYGRDRAERDRAARLRSEEKQRKKDEKAALRKAQNTGIEPPIGETVPPAAEKQSVDADLSANGLPHLPQPQDRDKRG
jgi:hypothetical protein